jgi:hypothetical protein
LLSQALTLYTTPVIYIFFDGLGQRFSRFRSHSHPDETSGGTSVGPAQPAEPS